MRTARHCFLLLIISVAALSVFAQTKPDKTANPPVATATSQLWALTHLPADEWRYHASDLPHGEDLGLDDSNWTVVRKNSRAPEDAVWYRRWIVVPPTLNGYDLTGTKLWFQFSASANGSVPEIVYFNGRRVAMGEDLEAIVLLDPVKPGDKVLVAVKLLQTVDKKRFDEAVVRVEFSPTRPSPLDLLQEIESVSALLPSLGAKSILRRIRGSWRSVRGLMGLFRGGAAATARLSAPEQKHDDRPVLPRSRKLGLDRAHAPLRHKAGSASHQGRRRRRGAAPPNLAREESLPGERREAGGERSLAARHRAGLRACPSRTGRLALGRPAGDPRGRAEPRRLHRERGGAFARAGHRGRRRRAATDLPDALEDFDRAPQGLEKLRRWRERLEARPLIAIGGISLADAPAVRDAGADCIAVISDVTRAPDPERRARDWLAATRGGALQRP